jgi:two-component system cell cycle response regulator
MSAWGKSGAPEPSARESATRIGKVGPGAPPAPCLARILVLSEDKTRSRELSKFLRRQGYATSAGDFSIATRKLARDEHPDLALIDAGDAGDKACKIATALIEGDAAHFPVVVLAENPSPAFRRRCLAAGIDDVVSAPASETILLSRIRPLVRLAIMNTELEQRAATARRLGIDVATAPVRRAGDETRRVIVTANMAENLAEIESALERDFELATARDVFTAASMLHETPFDALVVVIEGNGEDALYLCSQIRNNTRLFNLPALLVADRGAFESLDEPYRSGASAVLLRPLDETELQTTIESLVRRQKLRSATRGQLADIQAKAGAGEVGGVYRRDFLLGHLDRLAAAAESWRKHLSLVSFQIQNLSWVARDFGADAANDLLRQVAEWITVLVRAEDMVARHGDNEFCVVLPDTAIEDAEVVAQRISGVVLNTQFGVAGTNDPVSAWLQAGCTDFRPGDTAASLIARAHENLR